MKLIPDHDPGGRVRILLPPHVIGKAVFGGSAREYRYCLHRTWGKGPRILFVMMNPSTADPAYDDPTVAKCRRLAVKWGYGGLDVGNTFAYRATDQNVLLKVDDPIGPENNMHLVTMATAAAMVVFAYGKPKNKLLKARGMEVVRLLVADAEVKPHILRLSLDGTPCHPLYLPETLMPTLWNI